LGGFYFHSGRVLLCSPHLNPSLCCGHKPTKTLFPLHGFSDSFEYFDVVGMGIGKGFLFANYLCTRLALQLGFA
jgi:hypothetical protein